MSQFITPPISSMEITRFLVERGWDLRKIDFDGIAATRPAQGRHVEYMEVYPLMRGGSPSADLARHIACRSSIGYRVGMPDSLRAFQVWYLAQAFAMAAADMKEVLCSK